MDPAAPAAAFHTPDAVRAHLAEIIEFWRGTRDPHTGGFVSQVLADGTRQDGGTRYLVASARFVVQFALGVLHGAGTRPAEAAAEALEFLTRAHRDRRHGGYHWVLRVTDDGTEVADPRKEAYGHAFVLLAGATATSAGVPGGRELLDKAREICEEKLLRGGHLAVNTASPDWTEVSPYRGQNANMHLCEAFLAAYEATGDERDLQRAYRIADALARRIPTGIGGFVWENYREDWTPDWAGSRRETGSVESAFGVSPLAIPLFSVFSGVGLLDTVLGLVLTHAASKLPVAIWLLMAFIQDLPKEIEESAEIDGAGVFRKLVLVVAPLIGPGIAASAVLTFLFTWNDLLIALTLTSSEAAQTLPVGLTNFVTQFGIDWGPMSAAGVLMVVPTLLFVWFAQGYLVKGLVAGAVRG